MIPAQLYADLAEVCLRDAQAIAGVQAPEMSLDEIRDRALQLYGPGRMATWIVADQTEPTRRALRLLERRAAGEHDRLEALGLRLLEEAEVSRG